jgi:hypothetical protein
LRFSRAADTPALSRGFHDNDSTGDATQDDGTRFRQIDGID